MKKKLLFICWLLAPVFLLAFHYGPGQTGLAMDDVGKLMDQARGYEQAENWADAVQAWSDALALVPKDKPELRDRITLERAKARMYVGELPQAMDEMETMLETLQNANGNPEFIDEVRGNLARSQYYAAWLMRLEGAPAEEWTIPVENARQHYRLLAESASTDAQAESHKKNLESTIRLARMDLSQLQGLPLPKCCKGCKNVSQQCRSQRKSKCKAPGKNEGKKKKKDARGASFNDRPKGGS